MESTLSVKGLMLRVEGDLYAPNPVSREVSDGLPDQRCADALMLKLRTYHEIEQKGIMHPITQSVKKANQPSAQMCSKVSIGSGEDLIVLALHSVPPDGYSQVFNFGASDNLTSCYLESGIHAHPRFGRNGGTTV
jgi:hypothetical protein